MLPEPLNTIVKKPLVSLYVAGSICLVVASFLWWTKVSVNPTRVFWDTVSQSLATSAVTIEASQTSDGSTIHQTLQYSLGANNITHSMTTLEQGGTTVVDELIGTPNADYSRYVSVATNQKNLNLSGVIGVWAKGSSSNQGQLFGQAVLGTGLPIGGIAMPIANFDPSTRTTLYQEIKTANVYNVDFNSVKRTHVHGRLEYTYDVAIEPVAYTEMMQRYADALGLHSLDSLDPSSYVGQAATHMVLTVDAHADQVVSASIPASNATQTYSSYDVPVSISVPKNTVSLQTLQQRLQALQQ